MSIQLLASYGQKAELSGCKPGSCRAIGQPTEQEHAGQRTLSTLASKFFLLACSRKLHERLLLVKFQTTSETFTNSYWPCNPLWGAVIAISIFLFNCECRRGKRIEASIEYASWFDIGQHAGPVHSLEVSADITEKIGKKKSEVKHQVACQVWTPE